MASNQILYIYKPAFVLFLGLIGNIFGVITVSNKKVQKLDL